MGAGNRLLQNFVAFCQNVRHHKQDYNSLHKPRPENLTSHYINTWFCHKFKICKELIIQPVFSLYARL